MPSGGGHIIKAFVERGGNADLAAKLVAHPRLALGYAVDRRLVQGVDFLRPFGCLMQQLRYQGEQSKPKARTCL